MFEFVIALVLISTVGKVLAQRLPRGRQEGGPPRIAPAEMEGIREAIEELSGRVIRLEEERDFYRRLLEAPERPQGIPPPDPGAEPDPKD